MKKYVLFIMLFSVLYVVLVLLTGFFGMAWSWGHQLTTIEKATFFFLGGPFSIKEHVFLYVLPNAVFWDTLLYVSILLTRRVRSTF